MALAYRHRRYFHIKNQDQSIRQFSSTAEAKQAINFTQAWLAGNPHTTELLQNHNTTYVVTYEFDTLEQQTQFEKALEMEWNIDTNDAQAPWNPSDQLTVVHIKTEWLDESGGISSTWDLEESKIELTGGMRGGRFVIDM
jgi:hypothetical protein